MAIQKIDFTKKLTKKILISGASGSGKTTLLKTLPKGSKILFIDVEGGFASVANYLSSNPHTVGIGVSTAQDLINLQKSSIYLEGEKQKFDWIIIDSLTQVATIFEEDIIGKKRNINQIPSFPEWGALKWELEKFINFFKKLDTNVIFNVRTKNLTNDNLQKDIDYLLPTSARETIKGEFDIALYLTQNKGERVFITRQCSYDGGTVLTAKVRDEQGILELVEPANINNLLIKLEFKKDKIEPKKEKPKKTTYEEREETEGEWQARQGHW